MNYDPIHDTYTAPSQNELATSVPMESKPTDEAVKQDPGPGNNDNLASQGSSRQQNTATVPQTLPILDPEPKDPQTPQKAADATSEPVLHRPPPPPAPQIHHASAPISHAAAVMHGPNSSFKPFSIDNLVGGSEPLREEEPEKEEPRVLQEHSQPTPQQSDTSVHHTPLNAQLASTSAPNISPKPPQEHVNQRNNQDNPGLPAFSSLPPDFRDISRGYKYLKKADGEPFWRKDIQYDFLDELFSDETRCFTNYFSFCEVTNAANQDKLTFAELYVRTLAESNKLSKILRERLIKEKEMGIAVSKVCLLVNAGRMNTTVNFVPDMRSALRTYHLVPSLQLSSSGETIPLQDTPRLKTILKAVSDEQKHYLTLLDLFKHRNELKPNTNVIKLVFLMSTFFQNIPFHYDDSYEHDSFLEKFRFIKASPGPQNKFMEFFLNDEIHPKCRARRFLWLMYTYLETNFTPEDVAENPFNPHVIPPVETIPENEMHKYDVDSETEIEYAVQMYHTRLMHLSAEGLNPLPKKGNKSRRERLKIMSQINDLNGQPHTEDHDDLVNYDDSSVAHRHDEKNHSFGIDPSIEASSAPGATVPPTVPVAPVAAVDASSVSSGSQGTDKSGHEKVHKRKRPAPSVGSLVEDTRKPVLDEESQRLTTPEFPIEGLKRLLELYATSTDDHLVKPLSKDGPLSSQRRKQVAKNLKPVVEEVSKIIPRKFEATKDTLLRWLRDYFEYRKSVGSGLVGIEWEDIRSDIANGIEAYLYQQLGKHLLMKKFERLGEEDELDELKREDFGIHGIKGDIAPVDIGAIEKVGAGYEPKRDYNKINERTVFELEMLELLGEAVTKRRAKRPRFSRISFNLENASVSFR